MTSGVPWGNQVSYLENGLPQQSAIPVLCIHEHGLVVHSQWTLIAYVCGNQ